MLNSALPSELLMTAIASGIAAPLVATPLIATRQLEPATLAHRRLRAQLIPLRAPNYSPAALISAIAEFCRARRAKGVACAQVVLECTAVAAARLDSAGVRLVEVLARQSLACPVTEELDRRA